MSPTYKELVEKWPMLTVQGNHEAVVLAAYLAGRYDRLEEEIQSDITKAQRKEIEAVRQFP